MDEPIICVQLAPNGKLFAVWTLHPGGYHALYDFEWCAHLEQYIFTMAGSGGVYVYGDTAWWAAPGVDVQTHLGEPAPEATRLAERPAAAHEDIFLDGLEDTALWCSTCDDVCPATEPCAHCWWDEAGECYSTPDEGEMDPTLSKECPGEE